MKIKYEQSPQKYQRSISENKLSIYDHIEIGDPDLWIPTPELEYLLDAGLKGFSLQGLPLRTRSKVVKQAVCHILGYPVPSSFKRTQPRFPGQVFDIYVQKSNNLQIWNEEISPTRRYVIIQVSSDDIIERVKVITGDTLAQFDTTGTLTQKYQAQLIPNNATTELVTSEDTDNLKSVFVQKNYRKYFDGLPIDYPASQNLLPIFIIFERLRVLVNSQFADAGPDQERNRGAQLHQLICETLGYQNFRDDGRFPDIRNQLLEVKLQTSSTIDLGLVRPDSEDPLDIPNIEGRQIRHCDIRYALFHANTDGKYVTLTHFIS